jgi:hypothetical protein
MRDQGEPELIGNILARMIAAMLRDAELRAEVVAIVREATPPATPEKETDLTEAEIAKALRCSRATIKRTITPSRHVGASPRFDLADARAQLEARGKRPSTPERQARVEDVDVDTVVSKAGLRAVSGGKR